MSADSLAILAARMRALPASASTTTARRAPARHPTERAAPPPTARLLLRPAEAAELLGVSARTLRRWPIPRFTFGGVVGYRREDLEAFLKNNREPTPVRKGLKEEADRVTPSTP
jgi:hypothetical protein